MTMTFTYDDGLNGTIDRHGIIGRVVCSWTANGSGAATGTTAKIVGELIKGVTNPTDSPTDDYDITLTDEDGVNLLGGSADDLTDRDVTNSEAVYFNLTDGSAPIAAYPVVCGTIAVAVASAGSAKSGVLTLYYRRR